MAKIELGVKRRCVNCNSPFFDLNRVPIFCPKCGAAFQVVETAYSPLMRVPIRQAAVKRPTAVGQADKNLVLPEDEEAGEEITIPPLEDDDEIENVEEIREIKRDENAPDT